MKAFLFGQLALLGGALCFTARAHAADCATSLDKVLQVEGTCTVAKPINVPKSVKELTAPQAPGKLIQGGTIGTDQEAASTYVHFNNKVLELHAEPGRPHRSLEVQDADDCGTLLGDQAKRKDDAADNLVCWLDGDPPKDANVTYSIDGANKASIAGADLSGGKTSVKLKGSGKELKVAVLASVGTVRVIQLKADAKAANQQPAKQQETNEASQQATGRACTAADFVLPKGEDKRLRADCQAKDALCVTPSGETLHRPQLREGKALTVILVHPRSEKLIFTLDVQFQATRILVPSAKLLGEDHATTWQLGPREVIDLRSAGKLTVKTSVQAGSAKNYGTCDVTQTIEQELKFQVEGHYHFMLGIMPTYAGIYSRTHTLNRSDDGVQRVYAQDERNIDLALTLTGYPWGVSEDDLANLGIIVGTSVRDLGQRWYLGLELTSPIGLGLAAGGALVRVPELDKDFVSGQPLTDTRVPTHAGVEPTWFIGLNIEATLFKKAFAGLVDDDG